MNKKKKSTNISPYPDDVIDRLARAFYPAILACWNSEEGQREFAAWQAEQAHHANNEKQEVPTCWVFVKQFSRNDTATGSLLFDEVLPYVHTFTDVNPGEPLIYIDSVYTVAFGLHTGSFEQTYHVGAGQGWAVSLTKEI